MSIQISSAVWKARIGDPVAKLVLLKLADNADDHGKCWPSVATISSETELCERTIQTKIRALENAGLLVCNRGMNCCDYTLNIESITSSTPQDVRPAGRAPRRTCAPQEIQSTPQEMHRGVQEMRGGGAGDAVASREPSINRHRTVNEPSKEIREKKQMELPYKSKEFEEAWQSWIDHKKEIRQKMPESTISAQLKKLGKWGELSAIEAIDNSIASNWQGLFQPKTTAPTINHSSAASPPPRNMDVSGKTVNLPQSKQY